MQNQRGGIYQSSEGIGQREYPARLRVPEDRVWEAKQITHQKAPGTLVTLKSIMHYFQDFIDEKYPNDPQAKFKLSEPSI